MEGYASQLWQGFASSSLLEQSATVLGVLGVWLMMRQSLWAFPLGLVQVALSALAFYQVRLYADALLQVAFFGALVYGWWHWAHPRSTDGKRLPVGYLDRRGWLWALGIGLALTCLWGWVLAAFTDAVMPYRDAFIASFSLVAQWLQARKKIENWLFWILVNATAVPVYWLAGAAWFSALYLLFLGLAVAGYREWRRSERTRRQETKDHA